MRKWRGALAYAVLLAEVLLFYRKVLFSSHWGIPWDLRGYHLPLATYVANTLAAGHLPLWDPYTYCGFPFYANFQTQLFYPPAWPAFLVAGFSGGTGLVDLLEWQIVLHVFLGGVFAYLLVRRLDAGRAAATLGATVFQLGGYFASQAQHLGAMNAGTWLPLAWLSILHLSDRPDKRWLAILAASLALSLLAELLGAEFVPNDISLGNQSGDVMIITGPNMSGKSTYIRQTALLVLMAQMGSFVPAKDATIGLVDRIFTRVGASDELTRGQSTFMVEMTETANILNNATEKSLVVLDEVGRGTSTYDGLSLAWAITEYIANNIKCRTLFATHYHELTQLAELFSNVKNCNVAVREWMDEVVFLHKILPGGTDKSYGIHVAKLAGVPKTILDRSKEILEELENSFAKEATTEHLARHKTKIPDADSLFVQKHKSVLDKLAAIDINNLTPIEAINLLNQIKKEIENKNP